MLSRTVHQSPVPQRFRAIAFTSIAALFLAAASPAIHAQATAPAVALGNVNVGSSTSGTVTFTFTSSVTVTGVNTVTQGVAAGSAGAEFSGSTAAGGACANGTYASGATCTVAVTFTPDALGTQLGAVELATSGGTATGYVSGIGVGGLLATPINAAPSTLSTGLGSAQFLSVDAAGNLYVPSYSTGTSTVYKIAPGGGTPATLYSASGGFVGTAVDGAGNVYVSDKTNHQVLQLNSAGTLLATWPLSGQTLSQPNALAFDTSGNLYVADPGNGDVVVISPAGVATKLTVTGYTFTAYGLAVDQNNTVYISDYANNRILKVTSGGAASVVAVTGTAVVTPNGVAVDTAGDLYIAETSSKMLFVSAAGVGTPMVASGVTPAFSYAVGAALDGKGNLFVADQSSQALYQYNLASAAVTTSSSQGGVSPETKLALTNIGTASVTVESSAASTAFKTGPSNACINATVVAGGSSCTLSVQFAPTTTTTPQTGTVTVASTGLVTPFTANITGNVSGTATKLVFTQLPAASVIAGGNGGTAQVVPEDANGYYVTTPGTSISLSSNYGGTTSYGSQTVSASTGTATFSLASPALTTVGSYTYTATSGSLTSATAAETVVVGPIASVTIVPASTSTYIGAPDNMTITAYDAYGNVATSNTDTFALTSSDSAATLPANFTLSSGTATKAVTFHTIGTQTVTVTDTNNTGINGRTPSITIGADPVYTVTVNTDPASGTAANCNNTSGGATPSSNCALRDAFAAVAALGITGATSAQPTINFAAALSGQTISLGATIYPTANFNLAGPGAANLTISTSVSNRSLFAATSGALAMTLSGLTFSGVSITSSGIQGGVWVANQAGHLTTFSNDVFQSNKLNGSNSYGAAIAEIGGTLRISGSTFLGNSVSFGGGAIYLSASTTTITNSVFGSAAAPNAAGDYGGALYATNSTVAISGSTFTSNTSSEFGGAASLATCTATLTNNAFTSNTAMDTGGALYVSGGTLGNSSSPSSGNIFTANTVTAQPSSLYGGGAIFFTGLGVSAYLTASVFANNQVSGTYAYGGAIMVYSSVYRPVITINNSLFTGNKAAASTYYAYGGAIYQSSPTSASYLTTLTLTGNIFTGNQAKDAATSFYAQGGALWLGNFPTNSLYNDTITGNSVSGGTASTTEGGGLYSATVAATYYPNLYNTVIAANTTSGTSYPDSNQYVTGCGTTFCNASIGTTTVDTGILLSALGNYGGTAIGPAGATQVPQTIIPLPGSPALAAGSTSTLNGATTDARGTGYPRTTNYAGTTHVDAGAVEANYTLAFAAEPASTTVNTTVPSTTTGTPTPTVQIYESGTPFVTTGGKLAISASEGTPSVSSVSITASPQPISLSFPTTETDDTLIASIVGAAQVASTTSTFFNITDGTAATLKYISPPEPAVATNNTACNTAVGAASSCTVTVGLYAVGSNTIDTTSSASVTLTVSATGYTTQVYTVNAVNGVATFNLGATGLTPNGTYTYAATAPTYTTDTANATEIVGAPTGTIASFVVAGVPSIVPAGTGYSFTVTAISSSGTTDTTFTGPVFLTSSDPAAVFLPQNYTYNASDNGVHTFTVTFNTVGLQSITATTDGGQTGSETNIRVVVEYIWLVNATGTVDKLTDAGSSITGAVGTSATASTLGGIAFDSTGNVWSVTNANNALDFNNKTGTASATYSGGGLSAPVSLLVDGNGYIWIANSGNASVSVFNNAGTAVSGTSGFGASTTTGPIGAAPSGLAIDNTGGVWVASRTGNSVTHIVGAAAPVTTPTAAAVANTTVGVEP